MANINWLRVVVGGLAAGMIINAFEYGGHRVLLDQAWTVAFRALGKTPTGWATFIPANFLVGILMVWFYARLRPRYGAGPKTALGIVFWVIPLMAMVWFYARLRPRYGAGPKTALGIGLAAWIVFWVIPLMAMVPLELFPNDLLFMAIGLGVIGANLGAIVGARLYRDAV